MIKLYKTIKDELHYWEIWKVYVKSAVIHWGLVGSAGEQKTISWGFFSSFEKLFLDEVSNKKREGYEEIAMEKHYTLLIEYPVNGMGTPSNLAKRHALEERMQETLGWTGLGLCDGGSIGSGSMEVCCFVVDFKIAKRVIEADLADTEYQNYSRIYDENAQFN